MLKNTLRANSEALFKMFGKPADLYEKELDLCGISCSIVMYEDVSSLEKLWNMMLMSVNNDQHRFVQPQELYDFFLKGSGLPFMPKPAVTFEELSYYLTAGFSVVFVEGVCAALVFATQEKPGRSVQEPSGEGNLRGSREGFIEMLRQNMGLIRRRIRSEGLRMETLVVGDLTKTEIGIFYLEGTANPKLVEKIRKQLQKVKMPMLFEAEYLAPFLEKRPLSFFAGVGYTERPDILSAKICEGKVAVMVDGSPFAMILPTFFTENFQSMDDYAARPYFASFIRLLKYISFFVSILLPGVFVAALNFAPQVIPKQLLYTIASSEQQTPLPLFLEAILITFMLEVIREAGLRMPKPIGHSVSLVAALIIGDAAVKAGILSSPMIIVSAITAIATFVVPSLYEPITVLRVLFILAGGAFGPMGVSLLLAITIFNICAIDTMGVPYMAPITPYDVSLMRDGVLRVGWRRLARRPFNVTDLPGAHLEESPHE